MATKQTFAYETMLLPTAASGAGPAGPTGATGVTGPTGATGVTGVTGPTGASGVTANFGTSTTIGTNGTPTVTMAITATPAASGKFQLSAWMNVLNPVLNDKITFSLLTGVTTVAQQVDYTVGVAPNTWASASFDIITATQVGATTFTLSAVSSGGNDLTIVTSPTGAQISFNELP